VHVAALTLRRSSVRTASLTSRTLIGLAIPTIPRESDRSEIVQTYLQERTLVSTKSGWNFASSPATPDAGTGLLK
jgi:hypothetical protein